jgi:hypothetical protein
VQWQKELSLTPRKQDSLHSNSSRTPHTNKIYFQSVGCAWRSLRLLSFHLLAAVVTLSTSTIPFVDSCHNYYNFISLIIIYFSSSDPSTLSSSSPCSVSKGHIKDQKIIKQHQHSKTCRLMIIYQSSTAW